MDMGFKSNMVERGRGLHISKEKDDQLQNFPGLPPIFQGFPNWNSLVEKIQAKLTVFQVSQALLVLKFSNFHHSLGLVVILLCPQV